MQIVDHIKPVPALDMMEEEEFGLGEEEELTGTEPFQDEMGGTPEEF